ncbi:hypothetical protein RRG08_038670 [Elysia crispata]|uniref:Uncharacterized protein n=1 Tax=Elysia crispata TaxID=231223 RepID=A0AAE0ZKL7_9GAST|nr:hypothetical protein RRG08_038670 [Elysia crispata]
MSGEIYITSFPDLPHECNPSPTADGAAVINTFCMSEGEDFPKYRDASSQVGDGELDNWPTRDRATYTGQGKDEGRTVRDLLRYYRESATIHGIARIQDQPLYVFRRPLWFLFVLLMSVLLAWTLFNQITLLAQHPIRTVNKVTLNSELTFPAVTLCNLNQFIRDRVPDIPIVQQVLFQQSEYSRIYQLFGNLSSLSDLDNLTDVPGEELKGMLHHAAPRLKDFLLKCFWKLQPFDCQDLFSPVQTDFGICFMFNGRSSNGSTVPRIVSTSWSSLRVIVDTQNHKSYFSWLTHAGVKVVVHEPEHTPYPLWFGWYLRPGVAAAIALDRTDSSRLPAPYMAYRNGYCLDTKAAGYSNPLRRFRYYTTENCLRECLMDHVEKRCGCLSYNARGNVTVCSAKQMLTCEIPLSTNIQLHDLESCACPRSCHQVTYNADVTYADFASMFIQEQARRDGISVLGNALRENTLDIRLFFKSLNVYEVKQEPKLTRESIIGTVGGQMGLFLGASILSITEVAEILLLVLAKWVKTCALRVTGKQAVQPTVPG